VLVVVVVDVVLVFVVVVAALVVVVVFAILVVDVVEVLAGIMINATRIVAMTAPKRIRADGRRKK